MLFSNLENLLDLSRGEDPNFGEEKGERWNQGKLL